jgi:hypothetical protein
MKGWGIVGIAILIVIVWANMNKVSFTPVMNAEFAKKMFLILAFFLFIGFMLFEFGGGRGVPDSTP